MKIIRDRGTGVKSFGAIIGVSAYRKNATSNGLGPIGGAHANKDTGMQARGVIINGLTTTWRYQYFHNSGSSRSDCSDFPGLHAPNRGLTTTQESILKGRHLAQSVFYPATMARYVTTFFVPLFRERAEFRSHTGGYYCYHEWSFGTST